ncbi:hypothetical protein PI124_g4898 [Phytophthora idaei]|nr:hypothetical protein PI125_g13424 [Phytophthora idaei]KAG3165373.1 hypothetical protein PI126_g4673 [Phytophthora idaei]KAG3250473.1 hypothetical protein PI124_g4898 [Phytophthora idaei]
MVSTPSTYASAPNTLLSARTTVDPLQFDINSYLYKVGVKDGKCRVCERKVPWVQGRVISHKTPKNCVGGSEDEREMFRQLRADKIVVVVPAGAKRPASLAAPAAGPPAKPMRLQSTANFVDTITEKDAARVDAARANLVFRTGISFRVVDSNAMKEFVRALRPSYVERMPSAPSIAGKCLNMS